MIKRLLITAYVVAVLLIAGFARADISGGLAQLPVQQVSYDPSISDLMLHIRGFLPNRCLASSIPNIVVTSEKENSVTLNVVAAEPNGPCIQMIGGEFELIFDLRSIVKMAKEKNIVLDGQFNVTVAETDFLIQLDYDQLASSEPFSSSQLEGVVLEKDGQLVLELKDGSSIQLKFFLIDMQSYVNRDVRVKGHLFGQQLPILEFDGIGVSQAQRPPHTEMFVQGIQPLSL